MTPEQIAFLRTVLLAAGRILPTASDDEVKAAAARAAEEPAIADRHPSTPDGGRAAAFGPTSLDIPARTVREVVLATERPVTMPDYVRGEYVDEVLLMSGYVRDGERDGRIPMLDSHNRWATSDILGSMSQIRLDGERLLATAQFSAASPEAVRAFGLAQEGHLTGVSVGYRVMAATYIPAGDKAVVSGREIVNTGKRTMKIATRWTAVEGSLCAIGADAGCGLRQQNPSVNSPAPNLPANKPQNGANPMTREQIIALLLTRGYDAAEAGRLADAVLATPEGSRQAVLDAIQPRAAAPAAAPAPPAANPAVAAAEAAQLARVQGIRQAETDSLRVFAGRLTAEQIRTHVDAAIADRTGNADGLLVTLARAAAANQTPVPQGRAQVLADASDNARETMEVVMMHRAGVRLPEAANDPAVARRHADIVATHGGMRLIDMARHSLEVNGVFVRGNDVRELVGRAITHSSGDFTHALGTAARRTLLAAYQTAPANWRAYARTMEMADFRTHNLIRTSEFGVLDSVPEGGVLPTGTFSDKKETMALVSFKKGFSVTREAIINDDLGIFTTVPQGLARAWARTINQQAIKVLLTNAALQDGVALFHASHNNLDTATTAITTKETAEGVIRALTLKLQQQQDMDGKSYLQLMPSVILCSPTKSRWLIQAVGEVGRADNNRAIDIAQYNLRVVADMELENANLTGYGTNLTYAFANPADAPVVMLGFLGNNDAPMLESRDGWDVDGTEFKVLGDVAAGVADYRGAAKHVL